MIEAPNHAPCASEQRANNSMQWTPPRAAADAER